MLRICLDQQSDRPKDPAKHFDNKQLSWFFRIEWMCADWSNVRMEVSWARAEILQATIQSHRRWRLCLRMELPGSVAKYSRLSFFLCDCSVPEVKLSEYFCRICCCHTVEDKNSGSCMFFLEADAPLRCYRVYRCISYWNRRSVLSHPGSSQAGPWFNLNSYKARKWRRACGDSWSILTLGITSEPRGTFLRETY